MRDNDLFKVIIAELKSLLSDEGLGDIKIKQSYQPTQQSVSEERRIFMHKVSNPQVGSGIIYNGTTRRQQYLKRAVFQFDALAQQDPSDINSLTASDILTAAADLLQSYDAVRNLRNNGVNIERVTDVRPSYFINDKDRNESSPSFDLTVTYQHNYEKEIPSVIGVNSNLHGV
jgi:hypothetical protein